MKREFTPKEKVLLLILTLMILALGYYEFVYKATEANIAACQTRIAEIEDQNLYEMMKYSKMQKIEKELEKIKAGQDKTVPIPEYDNMKNLLAELNKLFAGTQLYNLSFSEPATSEPLVRREVNITFTTANYNAGLDVLKALGQFRYRCLLESVEVKSGEQINDPAVAVSFKVKATFFELPPVSAATTEPQQVQQDAHPETKPSG